MEQQKSPMQTLHKVLIPLLVAALLAFLGVVIGLAVGFSQAPTLPAIKAAVYFPPEYPNAVFTITEQADAADPDVSHITSGFVLDEGYVQDNAEVTEIPQEYKDQLENTFRENPAALGEVVSADAPRATDIILQETYTVDIGDGPELRQVTIYGDGRTTAGPVD